MKTLPARLYICPVCQYANPYRWVLTQHLQRVHRLSKKNAALVASANEFLANPRYYRADEFEDEIEDEDENYD
jgi:hypothetical protein